MITKKLIIIFLLIIALIIILIIKHNRNKKNKIYDIEHFILDLNVQQENALDTIVTKYYNHDAIYDTNIINNFGLLNTSTVDITKDLNNVKPTNNNTFDNIGTNILETNILNSKNSTINTLNTTGNLVNDTNNYNNFTKLNALDINSNTINTNNMNLRNLSIDNNLTITNPNFNNSTLYIDTLCFDTNNCIDKSIFNNFDKINSNKQKYISDKNQYMYLPNSRATNGNIINDNNLIWNNIRNEISPDNNAEGKIKSVNRAWQIDYNNTLWNGKNIYKLVYPSTLFNLLNWTQVDGMGIEVRVPEHPNKANGEDYTVLWVQTLNERWSCFRVYEYDINNRVVVKYFHKHAMGFNNLNKISPDGSTHNDVWDKFEWKPIPINLTGNLQRKLMISISYEGNASAIQTWFSGIAFSTNPWNHYKYNAVELHWQIHKLVNNNLITTIDNVNSPIGWWSQGTGSSWTDKWNDTRLAYFATNNTVAFRIPFVHSNKDKIFYIIEYNTNWGPSVREISIFNNNSYVKLGNLTTTFQNPFATHFNSKRYQRYYAVRIPKELLPPSDPKNNNFINLLITIGDAGPNTANTFYFTEAGTHDMSPF